ncbi:aminotransferase class V-fold PLP-dependent enzyme [Chitinophaga sp. Mgbs1]|uniref:Aminotransferase class V-fold PLP-dependent enzyme n=1 Tax=Chitinophaga solisilvae TaxID=1233460 RepID=A0A433WGG1_9BACT|nr:aminotransferase class V-fold PLP-dependent enzyme [Chitinophaga solisilvae]
MQTQFSTGEIISLRKETRGCEHVIHLNNAGAGLMPDIVTNAVTDYIQLEATIGGYEAAALKAEDIRGFYTAAAALINARPSNIAFTSSATDAYTRALSSIPFVAGDVILTSNDDFISNQIQFLSLQKRFGIKIARVRNAPEGGVDLEDLERQLKALRPKLVSITHIPTNSGLVQPVEEIGDIVRQYDTWYLLDACQSIGQMPLDVTTLQCDFLSVTCRKFLRGPRGTGFLYVSDRALQAGLEPLFIDMRGAEWIEKDEYRQRADATRFEDWEFAYAQVLGTRYALEYCRQVGEGRIWQRVKSLAAHLRRELAEIPGVNVLDRGPELGGLVTFTMEGGDPVKLVDQFRQQKINVVPSYRGFAVIDFDEKQVQWALRASPHYYNTADELDEFISKVKQM